jgi:hypothetical protein
MIDLQLGFRSALAIIALLRLAPSTITRECCANTFGERGPSAREVQFPPGRRASKASGPEMDRFGWDKNWGGIVNEERTQDFPAVLRY